MRYTLAISLLIAVTNVKAEIPHQFTRNLFAYRRAQTHSAISTPIQTKFMSLYYAKASSIAKWLKKSKSLLSDDGSVYADLRTNQLLLRDDSYHVHNLMRIIRQLDKPEPAVMIKARIVSVDSDYARELGILFAQRQADSLKKVGIGSFAIPIAKLSNGDLLDIRLQALTQAGHASLIANPQLMTLNRQAAMIESGEQIPYQEKTGNGNTSVAFKKAVLRLKVVPTVMPNRRVLLNLRINQDTVSSLIINGTPAIRTQQLNTSVIMRNRQTFALGGIYQTYDERSRRGVPVLNRLPVLGRLFRENRVVRRRKQLFIFVTPEIIR